MKLGEAAARGTAITMAVQVGQTIIQFVSVIVLARLLTPTDFGLVGMVTAVIGVAYILQDFGLSMAAIQAKTITLAEQTNLFWANFALGILCSLIMAASTPLVVMAYGEPRLSTIVPVLSSVFLMSGFAVQFSAMLSRQLRFKALGVLNISAQAISVAVAIVLAWSGAGFWSIVAQQLVYSAAVCVLSVALTRWWPGWPARGVSIKRFMRFGAGVLGTQVVSYLTKNVDNIAIGVVWGAGPLGFYSRAYQLMMAPLNKINAPMTRVALPILSRVQDDDVRLLHYLRRAQMVSCYLTASVFAVMAGLAKPIVLVLFGERWIAVTPIFAVLAVGGIFRAVSQISYWAYLARGASGALFRQWLVTGTLTIVIIVAGVPWGTLGVAVGVSVAAVMSWAVALVHVGKAARLDSMPLLRNAAKIIVCVGLPCGACGWVGTLMPFAPFLQVLAGTGIAGVYFVLASITLPWMRSDVRMSLTFLRRSIARSRPAAAS